MEYKDMTYGKAIDTIEHIKEHTDAEIALAIYRILNMTTIMAVKSRCLSIEVQAVHPA